MTQSHLWKYPETFDIIVVGGGHAGCEAAFAASRMGMKILLLTMNLNTIAQMSCNPSIGGIGKGHIVREIDAIGGLMGKAADANSIQFRMLNTKKGPAVQAPRSQADKEAYKTWVRHALEKTDNLSIKQGTCEDLLINSSGAITGLSTKEGIQYESRAVILTSGTFMRGLIHIGEINMSGGRAGDAAAQGLSKSLESLGVQLGRLKTGTPVRVHKRSIDFSLTEAQPGDEGVYFSFDTPAPRMPQVPCHITYTTEATKEIILKNLHRSPMYSGKIIGIGPRYCPSIEDKVVRFAEKERHQIFLEPEGLTSEEIYVNGVSSSLPFEVQYAFIKSIPSLRNAEIMRPGYAIEYDYVTSGQIDSSLASKQIEGLFFGGQINGTTGYEEAAAQGLIAGINATRYIQEKAPIILGRDQAYIGVMIDDLVTKGIDEPYRMFTSRAEHRLLLRQDNADLRLRHIGYELGLISQEQYERVEKKRERIQSEPSRLKHIFRKYDEKVSSLDKILSRPEICYKTFLELFPNDAVDYGEDTNLQIEINMKYEGYISRQMGEVEKLHSTDLVEIPKETDFHSIQGLRTEAKLRLTKIRPHNLGQASRIPGIAPSDISVLLIALEKRVKR
ncbi:MAG: tRNA uridine-5-carboxymethylaminomethyl(34) synthesis enzyme MnmG [Chlamydia sp.]